MALVALVTMVVGRVAVGQSQYSYEAERPFHQQVPSLPVEFGFSQYHSSTALEGALRGKAAVIQALGNLELSRSQAAILREQARALDRENDVKQTVALQAQQALWQQAREAKRERQEARVAEGKARLAARAAVVYGSVYALSADELNPRTGQIGWTAALESPRYAAQRERIEELFRAQARYGEVQPQIAEEIRQQIELLSRMLRRDVEFLPRDQYVAAQKLLRGLKYAVAG